MTDLVEFLRERLDEDEEAAMAASSRVPWKMRDHESDYWMITGTDGAVVVYDEGVPSEAEAHHIARHDPSRVLADVAAKRAILAEHRPARFTDTTLGLVNVEVCSRCHGRLDYPDDWNDEQAEGWRYPLVQNAFPCGTLRALALPFRDHPDFNPAWTEETP